MLERGSARRGAPDTLAVGVRSMQQVGRRVAPRCGDDDTAAPQVFELPEKEAAGGTGARRHRGAARRARVAHARVRSRTVLPVNGGEPTERVEGFAAAAQRVVIGGLVGAVSMAWAGAGSGTAAQRPGSGAAARWERRRLAGYDEGRESPRMGVPTGRERRFQGRGGLEGCADESPREQRRRMDGGRPTRTLQLTRPSVATLPRVLAAECQSLARRRSPLRTLQ